MTEIFGGSELSFLDMAANQRALGEKLMQQIKPTFAALGLDLDQFVVENISLPDQLQTILNQRIGMNMVGDLGRYAQFTAAESMPIAAANTGGGAAIGVGLGAGAAIGQTMMNSFTSAASQASRFCTQCGKLLPAGAHFCPECGKQQ